MATKTDKIMPNIVKPTNSSLFYGALKTDETPQIFETLFKIDPPATLIDNTTELSNRDGVLRGNMASMLNFIITNAISVNGNVLPDFVPDTAGQTGLNTEQKMDAYLEVVYTYFANNMPTEDYTLILNKSGNVAPANHPNNYWIGLMQDIFTIASKTLTVVTI